MIAHGRKELVEALIAADLEPRQSYDAGKVSRLDPIAPGIFPTGADADTHYSSEMSYFLAVERARDAVRNNPLVEQGVNRLLANLQICDVTFDVNSGDDAVDADLKAWWRDWCDDPAQCDFAGERCLGQIANQSFFNQIVDGDIVHLPLGNGRIQTFESHQLRTPYGRRAVGAPSTSGTIHGVEVTNGRVSGYWLTPQNVSLFHTGNRYRAERVAAWNEFGEKNAWHLGFKHRFAQRRGISRLGPARYPMTGFDDLNWAHINSAKRRALIAFLHEQAATGSALPFGGGAIPQTGPRETENDAEFVKVIEVMGEPAAVIRTKNGDKLNGWNADMPGAQFFEHAALLLSMLAVNLDLPLSFLLLDGSLVNFHGGRMVFDQARMRFRQLQAMQIHGFYRPVYKWRIRQRITHGSVDFDPVLYRLVNSGKVDPFACAFRAKGWPYVKPSEDVAAQDVAERRNLKSLRGILAEQGVDLDDHIEEIVSDRGAFVRRAIQEAVNIKAQFKDVDIDVGQLFRELWYGPNPTGAQIALGSIEQPEPQESPAPTPAKKGAKDAA